MCKLDLKDAYFTIHPKHTIQETSKILVEREIIQVSTPSFRIGTSIQESPDFNTQETDNLLGRPVTNWVELTGNLLGTGQLFFFPPGMSRDKLKEVHYGTPDKI